ncbi:MAG: glycosyltransferase, partial [Paludibacter sp.]
IPTYNYKISSLVADLHHQALEASIDFEIIVMEDGSKLYVEENKKVNDFEFCRHIVLTENIGRSAIRNKLADNAKYEHLLFMDCDAEVCSTNYIEKYITFCKEECVVIGGTTYDPNENDLKFSLRLKYGREREAKVLQQSIKNKHRVGEKANFATFNFLISKSIFNKVRFDESIRGYGHEDTLFGHQLHELGCEFLHIDNPLIHKGLDDNKIFIKKTEEGTRNLYLLYKTGRYPYLKDESKLLNAFFKIDKFRLTRLFAFKFTLINSILRKQLSSPAPSLLVYDLYKILFLCKTSFVK